MQPNQQTHEDVFDTAAQWLVTLRSADVSHKDHVAFSDWLNADSRHQRAFDELLETWEATALAVELPESSWDPNQQTANFWQKTHRGAAKLLPGPANSKAWISSLMATAAALLVVFALTLNAPAPVEPLLFNTAAGQLKTIELPDGSQVTLNTRTSIAVLYSQEERRVELRDGEAYFDVAPNKRQPFIVDVGQGTVTAVGTAFNILKQGNGINQVQVTEGVVRVKQQKNATTPYPESKFVKAHQQLQLASNGISEASIGPIEVNWLHQVLSFDNTPLPEVLHELNRYLAEPVTFDSQGLSQLRLTGTFHTDEPEQTLAAIAASFDLSLIDSNKSLHLDGKYP